MHDLVGRRLGPYELRAVVGRGGMATVYEAYQESLDRVVAVKVLADTGDPQFVTRFQREAQLIAKLEHRNIVPIHDYGDQDGVAYLVLQYVQDGRTLADLAGTPLALARAVGLLTGVLAGLGHAHDQGWIHRDVKPSNVLLPDPDWPLLADFGIAKLMQEDAAALTATGRQLGTVAYMAPEQALGLKVDARADLYAVGVVLFELLTGRVPFQADTPSAVLLQHVYRAPPSARELNHELPRAIEAVLARSLTKDPNDRYQRADEMAEALREGLRSVDGLAGATVGSHADGSHGVGPGSPVPPAVTVDRRDATAPRATSAASWAARVRSWPRPVLAAALGLVIVPLALLARGAWSPGRAPEPPAANAAGQPSEQPETEGLTPDADAVPRPASPADTTAPVRPAGPTVPPTPSVPLRAPATPPASQEAAQLPPATPEPPVAPTATTAPEPTTSVAAPSPSPSPSPARTPPSAPSDLRVAAVDPHSIRLEWDDNSVDELGFTVSNGDTEVTLGRDVTSYVWSRLAPETQMCFTLRAFNDVGRSRSAPDQCATTPGAPATATVKVSSTAIWVDTGITLEPGQQLTINARGSWTSDVEAPNTGPDGYPEPWPDNFLNLDDLGACPSCATTLTPGHGALVGYRGEAPPTAGSYTRTSILPEAQRIFMVGSSYTESVTEAGRLWLAFNTDAYSAHTADNAGMVSAEITVR